MAVEATLTINVSYLVIHPSPSERDLTDQSANQSERPRSHYLYVPNANAISSQIRVSRQTLSDYLALQSNRNGTERNELSSTAWFNFVSLFSI